MSDEGPAANARGPNAIAASRFAAPLRSNSFYTKLALIIVMLGIGSMVPLYWWKYPNYTYRYRLTMAIEIDGKLHTGSSVIEVTWAGGPEFGDVGPYHPRIRGQAAFIDIAPQGAVVATLGHPWTHGGNGAALWLAARAFGNQSTNDELPNLPRLSGRRNLTRNNMPELLWFSTLSNPATARVFRVEEIPMLFGPTARLAEAFVEITSDPIVIDIDAKLPWYKELAERQKGHLIVSGPNESLLVYNTFIGDGP